MRNSESKQPLANPLTCDSRGNRSRTLPFVAIAFTAVTVKFVIGGLTLGPLGMAPEIGAGAYGSAVLLIVGLWVGREWKQKEIERV